MTGTPWTHKTKKKIHYQIIALQSNILYFMIQLHIKSHALRTGVTTVYLQYNSNKRTAWHGDDLMFVLLNLFPETKHHKRDGSDSFAAKN